jgi:hypothetical protein
MATEQRPKSPSLHARAKPILLVSATLIPSHDGAFAEGFKAQLACQSGFRAQ